MGSDVMYGSRRFATSLYLSSVLLISVLGDEQPAGSWDGSTATLPQPDPSEFGGALENVTVQTGDTAHLPCSAAVGGDSPVWIRRKDYHILTGGKANYITDQRFQVLHKADTTEWTLQIRFVEAGDHGTYECQVSSGSGYVSRFVHLHVYQPVATITSGTEYHVQRGTTIQLVCVVEGSLRPPSFVFWYHEEDVINYDKQRGGITVETESPEKTFSKLTITNAKRQDSGNYSCKPSNAEPVSVHVYVSQGDKIAAIQGKGSVAAVTWRERPWLGLLLSVAPALVSLVTR
ncbi:zwei Ig domain protein zig-8-like [Amphibalanus amphitrite]|uniref:zwei Ig domain protein zig-8-like n=1 Tax=Amphibalanus amphitrite TaxID=1232801 RepID=UPI001C90189C|nr:zwei Ig domain protein zig-8-like [Amphibalanus amphitrite]